MGLIVKPRWRDEPVEKMIRRFQKLCEKIICFVISNGCNTTKPRTHADGGSAGEDFDNYNGGCDADNQTGLSPE